MDTFVVVYRAFSIVVKTQHFATETDADRSAKEWSGKDQKEAAIYELVEDRFIHLGGYGTNFK